MKVRFLDVWGEEYSIALSTDDKEIASIFVNEFPGNSEIAIELSSRLGAKDKELASVTFWRDPDVIGGAGASIELIYQKDRSFLLKVRHHWLCRWCLTSPRLFCKNILRQMFQIF